MTLPDDEFDAFLARRKHVFSRRLEDPLEPPGELDRIVLREARAAIQSERPARVHRGPHWGAPLAIAATLVLAVTVILNVGLPQKQAPVPEVTVQTVAQRRDVAPAPMAQAPAERAPAANNSASSMRAPAENAAVDTGRSRSEVMVEMSQPAVAKATPAPLFRRDSKTWLAEIERLRADGNGAQADAEFLEYKRQHRAYAVSPDR